MNRTNKILLALFLLLLAFTYYWQEVRDPWRLTDDQSGKRTLLYYVPDYKLWQEFSSESWHLKQKEEGRWWVEELARWQSKEEVRHWQQDLSSVIVDSATEKSQCNSSEENLTFHWRESSEDQWQMVLCRPVPLSGKFLLQLVHENKSLSRKKELWFWAHTDRAFDGLYRDLPDRYAQAYYAWREETNSLRYVSLPKPIGEWLSLESETLRTFQVAYPKRALYHNL